MNLNEFIDLPISMILGIEPVSPSVNLSHSADRTLKPDAGVASSKICSACSLFFLVTENKIRDLVVTALSYEISWRLLNVKLNGMNKSLVDFRSITSIFVRPSNPGRPNCVHLELRPLVNVLDSVQCTCA